MFVLQAQFAYDDPVVGCWDDEATAVAAANGMDRADLEQRLEAAECGEHVCNLCTLLLQEVGPDGVEREVLTIKGEDWCDKNDID